MQYYNMKIVCAVINVFYKYPAFSNLTASLIADNIQQHIKVELKTIELILEEMAMNSVITKGIRGNEVTKESKVYYRWSYRYGKDGKASKFGMMPSIVTDVVDK